MGQWQIDDTACLIGMGKKAQAMHLLVCRCVFFFFLNLLDTKVYLCVECGGLRESKYYRSGVRCGFCRRTENGEGWIRLD